MLEVSLRFRAAAGRPLGLQWARVVVIASLLSFVPLSVASFVFVFGLLALSTGCHRLVHGLGSALGARSFRRSSF